VAAGIALCSTAIGAVSPGKVGVYATFYKEFKSPYALRQVMREIKAAGIEFILPTAKSTSGKVNWDSKIAPPELVYERDYLRTVIEYAHAEGLQVYPVFCPCPEGGDKTLNDVLKRNPSWAFYFDGARRGYIDPGNPEARRYETSLVAEMIRECDPDGLSLDYLRCPNRVGYTDSGRAEFLAKRNVDLAKLVEIAPEQLDTEGGAKAASAVAASARKSPVWPEWKQWRADKVNALMREIAEAARKAKPGLPVSSYVWGARTYVGNYETCQDWKTWINQGWIDWINPSGYRYTEESFWDTARENRAAIPTGFPYYITIGVKTSHGELKSADEIKRQIRMSREAGADGIIFFTWESLRPFLPEVAEAIRAWRR